LNLSRKVDRELLPALFETDDLETADDEAIAGLIAKRDAAELVARGRSMGLAIAAENEGAAFGGARAHGLHVSDPLATRPDAAGFPEPLASAPNSVVRAPRVLDLSALWAGPLAAHLLWLAGAEVVKVESRTRPDAMRLGNNEFYSLLNQG